MTHHLQRRDDLGEWLNGLGLVGSVAEIGVCFGGFSKIVLQRWNGKQYLMVDPWVTQNPEVYRERQDSDEVYRKRFEECCEIASRDKRVIIMRNYSHDASRIVPDNSLDCCYLDGNHSFEAVSQDLRDWWPKVKQYGVMMGHDYYNDIEPPNYCEVKRAVLDWTGTTIERSPLYITNEVSPTWYVFKQPAP